MTEIVYTPGVCNIGPEEIAQRKKIGALSFVGTIILTLAFLYWDVSTFARIFLFIPALLSSLSLLQAYAHFCVAFAQSGIFNFVSLGNHEKVADPAAHKKDLARARTLFVYAAIISILFTAFVCII